MEDPTWFWGGIEPWKPPQRHVSNKRLVKEIIFYDFNMIDNFPDTVHLGGFMLSPLGRPLIENIIAHTNRNREGKEMHVLTNNPNFCFSYVPREKLRLCEEQRLKPPAPRPKLYYKQYDKKYWN